MSETLDVTALGPHFNNKLAAHLQEHETKTTVMADRKEKLARLRARLQYIIEAEGLRDVSNTKTYPVKKLDNGTEVGALLTTYQRRLPEAAARLVDESSDTNQRYINHGSLAKPAGSDEVMSAEDFRVHERLVSVNARLETTSGTQKTLGTVLVGTIEDPETIIVPEPNPKPEEGGGELVYRRIGPDDSRFEPIMAMVDIVNQGVGPWGDKPHVG